MVGTVIGRRFTFGSVFFGFGFASCFFGGTDAHPAMRAITAAVAAAFTLLLSDKPRDKYTRYDRRTYYDKYDFRNSHSFTPSLLLFCCEER